MKMSGIKESVAKSLIGASVTTTLGGDPEFFITEKETGRILNADRFFPPKTKPLLVKSTSNKESKLFFDGIQAEVAVVPQTCREYLAKNYYNALVHAKSVIPKDTKILIKPAARIDKEILTNADPEARRFGCAPDFNAYTLAANTPAMDASTHPFRYAGGHIHLGKSSAYLKEGMPEYDMVHTEEGHLAVVKFLDLMLGIPALLLDRDTSSKIRRSKYGKAGCFRPTPYGIEYRTLSCWWLKSPMLISLVYGIARQAWSIMAKGKDRELTEALQMGEEDIRGAIDESDYRTGRQLWKRLRPYLVVSGFPTNNPLNILAKSHYGDFAFPSEYNGLSKSPLKALKRRGVKNSKDFAIFGLAIFEYMVEHGIHSVISEDLDDEWCMKSDQYFSSEQGFLRRRVSKLKNNDDFMAFQKSLYNELY